MWRMLVLVAVVANALGWLPAGASGQVPASTATVPISSRDLLQDAAVLRRCLEAIHPGLYRYNTAEQVDAHFRALTAELARDMTRSEAFVAFSRFAATISCGHTFANPYNQGKLVMAEMTSGRDRLPLRFRWIDGRMIVTGVFPGGPDLAVGSEVLTVNARPVATILDAMLPLSRADGSNDAKRVAQLELRGEDRYEIFDFFLSVLVPARNGSFDLEIRSPGSDAVRTLTTAAMTDAERAAAYTALSAANPESDAPLWRLERRSPQIGYLKMPNWVTYKSRWDWKASIHAIFDELIATETANLIIDLRGNEGGTSVGDEILTRLITAPIPWSENERFVRYIKTPDDLNDVLDTWDDSFRDRSREVGRAVDLADRQPGLAEGHTAGFYLLRETDEDDQPVAEGVLRPAGARYHGRVFVLVNADNSSATFSFAQIIQNNRLATLVGQQTGGNQRGINGGAYFFVRLPHSRVEIDLPQIGYFPKPGLTEPRPDAGVTPDILVPLRIDDIASGRDAEMDAVLQLIK